MRRPAPSRLSSIALMVLFASFAVAGGANAQTTPAASTPAAKPGRGIYAERGPDGSITRQAWMAAADARATARFDALDTNHDGILTKAELSAGRKPRQAAAPKAAPKPAP